MLWTVFLRDTKGPSIHVDVTLTCTTYLAIVSDHVYPFFEPILSGFGDLV